MKLFALALDYDGTIARDDRLDPSVKEAIAEARTRGVAVLIVTGRILHELQRVAGDLHFVDAVIAENGAVLHFPESGHTTVLAPALPTDFLDELVRRGISFRVGESLVDAAAEDGARILEVIRALEAPLVLAFNKSRVMTMPQGISKGTGLRAALDTLRLSARNTLAIGDAENDHELLRLAEVGVALPRASAALRAAADHTLTGSDPAAVAAYLHDLTHTGDLPADLQRRRQLLLGHLEDGTAFRIASRGRNVLIAGDSKSGKSWVTGLLCEQLILHGYCVCVLDPEGDYRALEGLPGVTVAGGDDPPPSARDVMRMLRYPDRSLVIDLSRIEQDAKIHYIRSMLPVVNMLRRRTGLPHRIVVDEAHYFLHDPDGAELLDLDRNGYTVATYCASRLPQALLDATEVMLVTCESNTVEIEALRRCCESNASCGTEDWASLSRLRVGQAAALPITAEARGRLQRFTIAPRLTLHVRHRQKYVDVPVSEGQAFVFTPEQRVRTLRRFVERLEGLSPEFLDPFIHRGDFSRWIKDVFGDHALAVDLKKIEARHRGRRDTGTAAALVDAIRSRYDLREDAVPCKQA